MNNDRRSFQTFADALEKEIELGEEQGSKFSVVVLSPRPGMMTQERTKLLDWGEMVLRTHAPEAAVVTADMLAYNCLMLVPELGAAGAEACAGYYGEQLNKLPVSGVAPGLGWHWDYATYPLHRERLMELSARLSRGH